MENKAIVYTTQHCPHCRRAKNVLERNNIEFCELDLTYDLQKKNELMRETGWATLPMIFWQDELIGGADDLEKLEQSGELAKKFAQ